MQNLKALMVGTVLGTAAISGVAQAEVSANIGVASQYIFRGMSLTDNAQVFGGLDWESDNSGLYAGAWVSSAGGADELDLYGGYAFKISDGLSLDLGYIAYLYPSSPESTGTGSHGNTSEIYVGLAGANWSTTLWYNFGADGDLTGQRISNATGLTPAQIAAATAANNDSGDEEFIYLEGNIEFPLQGKLGLGLHLGYTALVGDDFDGLNDDSFFDYGVSVNAGDFSLAITATSIDNDHDIAPYLGASDRPQVTVSWSKSWDGLTK